MVVLRNIRPTKRRTHNTFLVAVFFIAPLALFNMAFSGFVNAEIITPQNLAQYRFLPGDAQTLSKDGVWFRDAQHRYVLMRGVNFGSRAKRPPYIPVSPLNIATLKDLNLKKELDAVKPQLDLLRAMGINVVRLPVMWKALEPSPALNFDGKPDERVAAYLDALKLIIDRLYFDEHIFVIIDFHQDIAHESYGGDGFPDWALAEPVAPKNFDDPTWDLTYYDISWLDKWLCPLLLSKGSCGQFSLPLRRTMQLFWNDQPLPQERLGKYGVAENVIRPRRHLETTIGQVARYFFETTTERRNGHPGILGYEPFNEPHPAGIDKKNFENNILANFYQRSLQEIRKYDDKSFFFVEPRMDWTTYAAEGPEYNRFTFTRNPESYLPTPFLSSDAQRAIFSFHYYDPWLNLGFPFARDMHEQLTSWPAMFSRLRKAADERGLIPFLTEFGCNQNWDDTTNLAPNAYRGSLVRACMDLQFRQIEAQLLNSAYWNYNLYNSKSGKDNWNLEDTSLLGPERIPRNTDIVARPYPMRSSIKPKIISFDLATKNAAIVLEGPVESSEPTVIFVPRKMHYPGDNFEIRATSQSIMWDEENSLIYWIPNPAVMENQLLISPLDSFYSDSIPVESRNLLNKTAFKMIVGKNIQRPVFQ